jgi:hypothetical protein
MADMNESTIRVIPFSGERKDFRMWSGKFLAQAEKMRYREALDGDLRVPEADEELSEEDTEKKKSEGNEQECVCIVDTGLYIPYYIQFSRQSKNKSAT